ncbi:MAG: 3-phosphoshikimate 1-carboxyvinyltransferase [Clostridiales bacterium]|nr:3-phosphoshikimate 1-carboxyvinyltransferase [Clostridiales bacterium]
MDKEQQKIRLSALFNAGKLGIEPGKLTGSVSVPQSKSVAHRALIMAFLAGDVSLAKVDLEHASDDILATRAALLKLQEYADRKEMSEDDTPLQIDCKESGSTLRFLIPLVAVLGIPTCFVGHGRLPNRPIKEYEGVFENSGAQMIYRDENGLSLPLEIKGKMRAGEYTLPGNVSSQYISGLLMALSHEQEASRIRLSTKLESEPYVNMTLDVMRAFGCEVVSEKGGYYLTGAPKTKRESAFAIEADYSQAAFWLVADYLGSAVVLPDLPSKTAQGDQAIETLLAGLRKAGRKEGGEKIFEMDASDVPDLVPVFAVAAAATDCETHIVHAERLALKESDRLASTAGMLRVLGADVEVFRDGMTIRGKHYAPGERVFSGGTIDTHKDHRLVMASAVAATVAKDTIWIKDPVAVEKSYPTFFEEYLDLGGNIHGINVG